MRGGVTDAGQTTNERTLKIELLSQWKLEAEFRNCGAFGDLLQPNPVFWWNKTGLNDVVTSGAFNIEMLQLFIFWPFPSELLQLRDCSSEKLKLLLLERISSLFAGICRFLWSSLLLNMYDTAVARHQTLVKILLSGPTINNASEQICHSDTER